MEPGLQPERADSTELSYRWFGTVFLYIARNPEIKGEGGEMIMKRKLLIFAVDSGMGLLLYGGIEKKFKK